MNITCFQCGASTSVPGAFREVHRSFRSKNVFYCPKCLAKQERRTALVCLSFILAGLSIFAALWSISPSAGDSWGHDYWSRVGWSGFCLVINLVFLSVFLALLVVPHELGHALFAGLLGWRVCRISLGLGRTLKQFRFAGLNIEINMSPGGGLTWIVPKEIAFARLKYFLIVLAGPSVHLAISAATLPAQSWRETLDTCANRPAPLAVFFFANLLMLALALLPYTTLVTCGHVSVNVASDGLAMVTAPFLSSATIRQWHGHYFAVEGSEMWQLRDYQAARQWYERGLRLYPDDISNRMGLGLALCFLNDLRGGREQWRAVLHRSDVPGDIRPLMLNNVAWTDLMIGDADLLDEAARFSEEAVTQEPWRPPFLGTRGSVLIERGEVEDGLLLVRQAFDANEDPRLKALNACYIALAEYKRGNQMNASAQLELARGLDPDCMLLEKMTTRLNAAPGIAGDKASGN